MSEPDHGGRRYAYDRRVAPGLSAQLPKIMNLHTDVHREALP